MTDISHLADRIAELARVEVLCVGDLMLDRYVDGTVERTSPEAPVPVLRIERENAMLGGVGNVVRNLLSLGARACLLAVVGDDEAGRQLIAMVGREQGVEPYLVVEPGRVSTVKTRFVSGTHQLLRADSETTRPAVGHTGDRLRTVGADLLSHVSVMILSDYAKGVLTPELCAALIARARALGKPVVVDPKGRDFARYQGASVITPNRTELAQAVGMRLDSEQAIVDAARQLIAQHQFGAVLVTRSQAGMSYIGADGRLAHLPAQAREVFDVSGAGDTVIATFAAGLGSGLEPIEAAALANAAAGIVVGKVGTAVVHAAELVRACHAVERDSVEAKIVDLGGATEQVARWRRLGRRIGFTNGCFDLLHPGHLALLRQAKAACDYLIVGLNRDESVKRLKGPERPVQPEEARAQVLASLALVDLVVPFAEDTPLALIQALRPDILVKGSDYAREAVVGGDLVEGYGGQVVLATLEPGFSTTSTIERLRR